MAKARGKNNSAQGFSEEWDYTHPSGVRAHIARRNGTSIFSVVFSHAGNLKLVNGDYEIQTDSKFIPHGIVDNIIADDIAAAQKATRN
ncbi:hypothetical protein EJ419_02295 [Alloscardovia theropitheci]|uniref:Uncharacterized protein n=1 Tax=Alloscardovia theropitheci TaxID=2496842 RepID=A0A4R0QTQ2_9BIFI|nr:hypothetical protein [Alloscardovia theropitheci]TCD54685.1 hypothetical protein EJ419_02295 [Alloscardovia theropitheci]